MSTDDPVALFRDQLPRSVRDQLHNTLAVAALVHAAVRTHAWTPKLLAAECARDLHGSASVGAVVMDRLRKAAQHPPAGHDSHTRVLARLPFCTPDCAERNGLLEDPETHLPIGKCPCRTANRERTPA